ncbi:MAG: hypothetical protein WHS86_13335 [Desulfosoma sp.]
MGGEWREHEVRNLIDAGVLLIGDGYRAKNDQPFSISDWRDQQLPDDQDAIRIRRAH